MEKNRRKDLLLRIILCIVILIGYTALMLPTLVDTYSRITQTASVGNYRSAVDSLSEEELKELRQKCAEYNESLAAKQGENPFMYTYYEYGEEEGKDDTYDALPLDQLDICVVRIPSINVDLAVGHGTGDAMLQVEAGHLHGTSLPTGDSTENGTIPPTYGTHAVIAAHSALRSAELFTKLDEVEEGDEIYIDVLGETHVYKVTDITVVLPEDANEYLQVEPNKDLLTLYTCTPYGINTHRLLVTAERVADEEAAEETDLNMSLDSTSIVPIVELGAMIVIPIGLSIWYCCRGNKEKKEDETTENN